MSAGLVLFVLVVVADAAVLIFDLLSWMHGQPTVTAGLRERPRLAALAVLAQLLIPVGLLWHLYG